VNAEHFLTGLNLLIGGGLAAVFYIVLSDAFSRDAEQGEG